jgi:hypothetical protein
MHDSEGAISRDMYVAWCDVMGVRSSGMSRFRQVRFKVIQFHALVMVAAKTHPAVRVVPAGDGVFATSDEFESLRSFLCDLFRRVTTVSKNKNDNGHPELMFMIRSAVAYGAVAEGLQERVRLEDGNIPVDTDYLRHVLVGPPVVDAFTTERFAPPLGIRLHASAQSAIESEQQEFLHWSEPNDQATIEIIELYFSLPDQMDDIKDPQKISEYLDRARTYFLRRSDDLQVSQLPPPSQFT